MHKPMTKEAQPAEYYDNIYRSYPGYSEHYSKSVYFPLWERVAEWLGGYKTKSILDVGCGTGQLLHYLQDQGFKSLSGFDFSEEAIRIAQTLSPLPFSVADVYDFDYSPYKIILLTEVLEHLEKD